MRHELKTFPDGFQAIVDGNKHHEVRPNDRKFQLKDELLLREFTPHKDCNGTGRQWDNGDTWPCCGSPHGAYSGRELLALVTYITGPGTFGLPDTHVAMSIVPLPSTKRLA